MRSLVLSSVIIALAGLSFFPSSANADEKQEEEMDKCRDVLQVEMKETVVDISNQSEANALYHRACTATLQEAKEIIKRAKSNSGGGGINLGIKWLTIDANGNAASANDLNQEKFNTLKQQHCSSFSQSDHKSAFQYYAQQTVKSNAVDNWKQCMLNIEYLTCYAEPLTNNEVRFVYKWNSRDPILPVVRSSYISSESRVANSVAEKGELLKAGSTIPHNALSEIIVKKPNQNLVVNLNVIHRDSVGHNCSAFVPAPIEFVPDPTLFENTFNNPTFQERTIDACVSSQAYEQNRQQCSAPAQKLITDAFCKSKSFLQSTEDYKAVDTRKFQKSYKYTEKRATDGLITWHWVKDDTGGAIFTEITCTR